jgi:hypothetical protein
MVITHLLASMAAPPAGNVTRQTGNYPAALGQGIDWFATGSSTITGGP